MYTAENRGAVWRLQRARATENRLRARGDGEQAAREGDV